MTTVLMEVILAVLKPKQNISSSHDYRPKFYDILLLDHKTTAGEKGKPTKYLPTFPLENLQEEHRDEVLATLYRLTGADHGGIKGERALTVSWNRREFGESLCLYVVPINARDKLNKSFVDKSPNSPGFYALDTVIETLNSGATNFPPPTLTFVSQLESWLKEIHGRPGALDVLFKNRADYRIKISVNNPVFLPRRFDVNLDSNGGLSNDMPEERRLTANEALTKMLSIEKCDIVVMNPLFRSQLPYKTKVNILVKNLVWGSGHPDHERRNSNTSSLDGFLQTGEQYPLHRSAADGNSDMLQQLINQGCSVHKHDIQGWTPLHYAASRGHGNAVAVLLDAGAQPNARNDNEATALHLAASFGCVYVAEILLMHSDINVNLIDKNGKTALDICEQIHDPHQDRIAQMIKQTINRSPLQSHLDIYLTDGAQRRVKLINGSHTTVRQLNFQLLREHNMPEHPYTEIFTIWMCSESLELQLKPDHRPIIELQRWKKNLANLTDATKEVPMFKWRRNAKIGLAEERNVKHHEAISILFHEACHNYIQALYPCKEQDVLMFASILIAIHQQGEFDASAAKSYINSKNLQSLVPGPMLKVKNGNWATKILHHYREHNSMYNLQKSPDWKLILMRQFLDFCRNLTVYGSAFFRGNLLVTPNKGPQTQTPCHIGVNDVGIHVINSQTRIMLQSFKYSEIEWGLPDVCSLEIRVIRIENKLDKNVSRNVRIRTKQAGLIDHLMTKLKQMHAFKDRTVDIIGARSLLLH